MGKITAAQDGFLDRLPDNYDSLKVAILFRERYPNLNLASITRTVEVLFQASDPTGNKEHIRMMDELFFRVNKAYQTTEPENQTYEFPFDDTEVKQGNAQEALRQSIQHWKTLEDLFETWLPKVCARSVYLKAPIPETDHWLAVRRGRIENNNGLEIVIGSQGIDTERRTGGDGFEFIAGGGQPSQGLRLRGNVFRCGRRKDR